MRLLSVCTPRVMHLPKLAANLPSRIARGASRDAISLYAHSHELVRHEDCRLDAVSAVAGRVTAPDWPPPDWDKTSEV